MRPERLVMEAFGPFGDGLTVDFRDLASDALFLIHGPTGSGKSTVLDAMCFALYGESSGADREAKELRSDHAPPTRKTRVVFDFALGSERYRIERTPPQTLAKVRGTGERSFGTEASLWRRTGCLEDEEGTLVASQPKRVAPEITRLLGLDSAQFRQLIVLPQGRFREFLSASSSDRQAILASLFGTEIYRRLTEALKRKAADLHRQVHETLTASSALLQAEGVATPAELDALVAATREQLAAARDRVAAATAAHETAVTALNRARDERRRLGERDEARRKLAACEAERPAVAEAERRLDGARRAEPLRHPAQAARERADEAATATKDLGSAQSELALAHAALAEAAQALVAEQAREAEREAARREADRLAALRPVVERLAQDRDAARRARADETKARDALERTRLEATDLETKLSADDAAVDGARMRSSEAPAHRAALEKLEGQRRSAAALQAAQNARDRSVLDEERATTVLRNHDADLARSRARVEDLTARWTAAQAAVLARGLSPGSPCPVCGATDHPTPAVDDAQAPSDAALKAARAEIAGLEAARAALEAARTAAVGERSRRQAELQAARDSSGGEDPQTLAAEHDRLSRLLKDAEKAAAEATRAEADRAARRQALERSRKTALDLDATHRGLTAAAAEAATLLAEHEAQVPAELRDLAALSAAAKAAVARRDLLASALEKARTLRDRADVRRATAERSVEETALRVARSSEAVSRSREAFRSALADSGFADESVWTAACLPGEERSSLDRRVEDFAARVEAARRRLDETEAAAAGLAPPEPAEVERTVEAAALALARATSEAGAHEARLEDLGRRAAEVKRLSRRQSGAEDEYRTLGRLAEVAGGGNPQRVDLERYVLSALLEDVLAAATARLSVMSRGRYGLRRQTETGNRTQNQGLDIEVLDSHTGRPRPASTLSGGEGFMAALSLALGLADTVGSYAGGRRMEAIFVDEGFGSLDDEALDQAFQVLVAMKGEGRLLGVISHVAELRRWIPVRLEMGGATKGTTVRVG